MQAPLIINADCIHICIILWSTVQFLNVAKYRKYTDQGPRQATQLRSWAGIGKVGILEFFLAFEEEKNFTPGPSARVGIFNFGKDRVRVGYRVYLQKKLSIGNFRVLEILIGHFRVHPNVVQFLYERFF